MVVAAFRKAGVQLPLVLRAGKSCHPDRWPVSPAPESTRAAKLYACGKLGDAHVDTTNLPRAVLPVKAFATIPNYLVSLYPDLKHAASTDFWLKTLLVPGSGGPYEYGPLTVRRKGNVVVAGFLRKSEIAAVNRALAKLK